MKYIALPCCLVAAITAALPAFAAPKVSTKTTSFPISGKSGEIILKELERKGPKHGFMSRAIAQTRYTMNTEADWTHSDGVCAVTKPSVRLDITYIYPRVEGPVAPGLKSRWASFMAGITRHEKMHGRIAREMAEEADRAVAGIRLRDGKSCGRLRATMKRLVAGIVARHEARQRQFDLVEHKGGGNIEGLIKRLVRN